MKRTYLFGAALALSGCGARTSLSQGIASEDCHTAPPICVAPNAVDPCGESSVVNATCSPSSHEWTCPSGARVYARATESQSPVCRPFHGAAGLSSIGGWGLSAMSRVPTDDGRCLWIADSATLSDATVARNVALQADPTAPFGTCPTESLTPPTPIVTMEGGDDPNILVQIDGGYRLGGATHVLYRLFRVDSSAVFGAVEIGGGVGRWDGVTKRIVVHSASTPSPWGLDLDLGDAQLVAGDGAHAFVWGCAQPSQFLLQGCELARLDANDAVELFAKDSAWVPSTSGSVGATLFGSGTWTSSVITTSSGFRHVYIGDFGNRVQSHVASDPTGPWTDGPEIADCDLPSSDPNSFCAGPIVHGELSDPTRPGEMAITYGVGSSKTPVGTPDDYWARMIWAK